MQMIKKCKTLFVIMIVISLTFSTVFAVGGLDDVPEGSMKILIHPTPQIPDDPDWASGSLGPHQSTHAFITDKAIAIMIHDLSYFPLSGYTTTIRNASDWPDNNENDSGSFKGHFYDPATGKNYLNGTSPTARTRLVGWYNQAIAQYNAGNTTTAMTYLGRALHYAEDLSTPHHAANLVAYLSYHAEYEQWVQEHQTNYIETTAPTATYTWAQATSISNIGHNFAVNAKLLIDDANSGIESRYATATATALPKAQRNAVAVLYKFCKDVGLV